ncbi:hypothetical protein E2P81_ATG09684 [Venturia nashicola]|uniref:DUF1989 domain-containing protein n=1 Tax=Venturia nashicola TaxID=86259 RepID=A0A4Z1NMP3_9PEZI|nr:hypothetical protein E6O75_ATG09895 [Venturia nashicola]TLD26027.1 hypothetical protein E2P81_ATG09684 [Venturia nashicola]
MPPKSSPKEATSIGEKQTIQARHGVATFVPKGHMIKIINTYGKQVVDTWAFALGNAPEDGDIYKNEEEVQGNAQEENGKETGKGVVKEEKKEQVEGKMNQVETGSSSVAEKAEDVAEEAQKEGQKASEKTKDAVEEAGEKATEGATKVSEKVDEKLPANAKKGWSSYLPSVRRTNSKAPSTNSPKATSSKEAEVEEPTAKSWSSYLPSIGGGGGGSGGRKEPGDNTNSQSKGWSSYIPSGVGFSYMPPKGALSGFAATHARDPTKSYAEQLYDFSKTPVGAAGLSAATGSGYAGSLYAAYKAYDTIAGSTSIPGMEYLSMMHTRAATLHISPRVNDTLVSNLRAPLMTLVEDSSPGIHDTLIAACDPQRYKELGVEDWETHGSCSENLVLALNEINEKSGLKGSKAIGRDVTVNSVPAPLNLFMNIPWTKEGDITFEAPKGKRGDYVKFRAERDLVVVMSACPQDILDINGRRPMVAHFVVESPSPEDVKKAEEKDAEAQRVLEKAKLRQEKEKAAKKAPLASKPAPGSPAPRRDSAAASTSKQVEARPSLTDSQAPSTSSNSPKPGRKAPKKLEKRGSLAPKS